MNITKNFEYKEFEATNEQDLKYKNMITTNVVRDNVKTLAMTLLQPLRDAWGSGLVVTSGYRCEELNLRKGGKKTSAHCIGAAADIIPSNGKREEFILFAKKWIDTHDVPFDQLINENWGWLHIGLKNQKGEQRREIFRLDSRGRVRDYDSRG